MMGVHLNSYIPGETWDECIFAGNKKHFFYHLLVLFSR